MTYDFDLFVIGGGSGGVAAARRAGNYGAKVGLAEADRLGGTCVNRGCVPKKMMVYASHFNDQFRESQGYGWSTFHSTIDWGHLLQGVHQEVERLNKVYQSLLETAGVQIFPHFARFIDAHTLQVGEETITAAKILIAVGGAPVKPTDIPGIEHAITSDQIFHLERRPDRIVILGGGYIGCEFACIFHRLGAEVSIVIRDQTILRGFDQDIRTEIQRAMIEQGIQFFTQARDIQISQKETGLVFQLSHAGGKEEIITDVVSLAATGRKPNLQNLGLDQTQVEILKGAIVVDEFAQTKEPHIFAVGDCTDRINLTPVAINEGRVFADTHFGNIPRQMSYQNIPTAIFTTPEAATVGLTEAEAITQFGQDQVKVYRSHFRSMYYVLAQGSAKTLMKLVVHQPTDRVLGVHMVGTSAAEIIQGIAIAVKMGATKADFDRTVGIHPTVAEEFVTMQ
jgi:glutathione reductase (NADPH)